MNYKGYFASIKVDDEAEILHGEVVGARDVITFQATTVNRLKKEFKVSIDDYLELCEEKGIKPDKSFSGRFSVRTTPEVHKLVVIAAETESEKSLNAWVSKILRRAASEVLEKA